jgi:hypothetical protein
MEFKIKTEPVCIVCVAIPVYVAVTIVSINVGVDAREVWYPLALIALILFVSLKYIAK